MKSSNSGKKMKPVKKKRKITAPTTKEKSQPVNDYCRDCDIPEGLDW